MPTGIFAGFAVLKKKRLTFCMVKSAPSAGFGLKELHPRSEKSMLKKKHTHTEEKKKRKKKSSVIIVFLR